MYTTTAPKIFHLILVFATSSKPTAYDALDSFNFLAGLLPKGALGYELDEETGKSKVYLNGPCSYSLEGSYQLNYKREISGHISKNKLTNLSGVSVKIFFVSLNIVEVRRFGDDIQFSVGIASANFPIDNFEDSPQCRCGFDCNEMKMRDPDVSSI